MDIKTGINVIIRNPTENPCCTHGPTILLSKKIKGKTKNVFVCAAQRDRKSCPFYRLEGAPAESGGYWKQSALDFVKDINHIKMFMIANEVKLLKPADRLFCLTCSRFVLHACKDNHKLIDGITDEQFMSPTEFLPPSENDKTEAQYWFLKSTVEDIVQILQSLHYRNVICIGAPRIFEYIRNKCDDMRTILLDFDKRFHNFFGPLEFCWYNMFNNHFYIENAKTVLSDFLKMDNGNNIVIITDPPFGGRTELISFTFKQINGTYQKLNKKQDNIPLFWIYPYFMEPHITYSDPKFSMLDYKVEYENHTALGIGTKSRRLGSHVRMFTTVNPSLIKLPEDKGYKYCEKCDRWVANVNKHCDLCGKCTSKNGSTYVHCMKCKRCVKSTWMHCRNCRICTQAEHECATKFSKPCKYCQSYCHDSLTCPNEKPIVLEARKREGKRSKMRAKNKKFKFRKVRSSGTTLEGENAAL